MRRFFKMMFVPGFMLVSSIIALESCTDGGSSGTVGACVPSSTQSCACAAVENGSQICQADGTWGPCSCNPGGSTSSSASGSSSGVVTCHELPNVPETCGNGIVDVGEECDDMNCDPTDTCNNDCRKAYCGDHVVQPPEQCDGEENCTADCIVSASSSGGSSGVFVDQCTFLFAGFAVAQSGSFSYADKTGLEAAAVACQALGGFRICDYEQWRRIETDPMYQPINLTKLAITIPPGTCTDAWLKRTTPAIAPNCPGGMAPFGSGGNCNDWNYLPGQLVDGEHVNICNVAGTITFDYKLDCDPVYDPQDPMSHQDPSLPCDVEKAIPCCFDCPW